jgi:putative transposase
MNLGTAWKNFFNGRGKRPTFHRKGINDSFYIGNDQGKIDGKQLYVPKLGWVRMRENFRYENAKIIGYVISRRAERWYVSISCEMYKTAQQDKKSADRTVGIDVGVNEYVYSDGSRYRVPQAYRKREQSLRRAQKSLSRKKKGSMNRAKARRKVAGLHASVRDARNDFLHKLTTETVKANSVVVVEDLNVKGMLTNHHLSKSISDAAFGEFRRQLTYKLASENKLLIVADRFFPSSKTCSVCGAKTKRLPLSKREWTCSECGTSHDRDLNAAINLKNYADSSAVSACGGIVGESSASTLAEITTAPEKQELNSRFAAV